MTKQTPVLTSETGKANCFNRACGVLWRKGATSGLVQRVVEAQIDDEQDAIWIRVAVAGSGASCHRGYMSCFCRAVPVVEDAGLPLGFLGARRHLISWRSPEILPSRPSYDATVIGVSSIALNTYR